MQYPVNEPDKRIYPILQQYAAGEISCMDAAYEIQAMRLPGLDDPSASEVVLWSKMAGFGIPTPSDAEVEEEVNAILNKYAERRRSGS